MIEETGQDDVVEITPKMIQAGADILRGEHIEPGEPIESRRRVAEAIFEAMMFAKQN